MMESLLSEKIEAVKVDLKSEYLEPHSKPWIIGFSGGKDSTLVLHLVAECLLELAHSQRRRPVHVVANDTLVESPIVQAYVDTILDVIGAAFKDLGLPVQVAKTFPDVSNTFWVNLIGRGYPAPTRFFRWCTDRMKIRPTTAYIRERVDEVGEVILLLGVRRSESTQRAKNAKRYDLSGRLNRHNDLGGCLVYRPILELSTEDVWEYLMLTPPPWGGTHEGLVALYKNAQGGECPLVIDPDAAPSCGSSSIRFGCWTCTVVEKDRSFRNSLDSGFEHLEPMADFRDWLKDYCYRAENRMTQRRNGQDGPGPLTFEARRTVLKKLLALQQRVGQRLISDAEVKKIKETWREDDALVAINRANRLIAMMERGRI